MIVVTHHKSVSKLHIKQDGFSNNNIENEQTQIETHRTNTKPYAATNTNKDQSTNDLHTYMRTDKNNT